MKLTKENLMLLSTIAIDAALKSGAMIQSYIFTDPSRKKLEVRRKDTGSSKASQVVTKVDFDSQEIILNCLNPTLEQYDLALLSEESVDDFSRFEKDYFWCIDPLDGTLAFSESNSGFSVSIALVSKEGMPVIGVIYEPLTQTTYSAIKGVGALKNNKPFKLVQLEGQQEVSDSTDKLTIIVEKNLMNNTVFKKITNKLLERANVYSWSELEIIEGGGAVINACQVLENAPAVYFKLPKPKQGGGCSWDFSATSCLFNELAGTVSDVFGNRLDLNKRGDTFMNHCGVMYASEKNISILVSDIIQDVLI